MHKIQYLSVGRSKGWKKLTSYKVWLLPSASSLSSACLSTHSLSAWAPHHPDTNQIWSCSRRAKLSCYCVLYLVWPAERQSSPYLLGYICHVWLQANHSKGNKKSVASRMWLIISFQDCTYFEGGSMVGHAFFICTCNPFCIHKSKCLSGEGWNTGKEAGTGHKDMIFVRCYVYGIDL